MRNGKTAYDIGLTALSLVAAAAVTSLGLGFAVFSQARFAGLIGGAVVGAGVACMHYTGMFALQVPGRVTWAPDLVLVSVLAGMMLGAAALTVAMRGDNVEAVWKVAARGMSQ